MKRTADQLLQHLHIEPAPDPDEAQALALALAASMPTVTLSSWQRQALREGVERWPA